MQAVKDTLGITAFGWALLRANPDIAEIEVAITRTHTNPPQAFAQVRTTSRGIGVALADLGIDADDVATSRATLEDAWVTYPEKKHVGYQAKLGLRVIVRDLGHLEAVLAAIVHAGGNEIRAVKLHTTGAADLRTEARRRAVASARAKAEIYAEAAGVRVGAVLHVEDRSAAEVGREVGHPSVIDMRDGEASLSAMAPGSVEVSAAVVVVYAIDR